MASFKVKINIEILKWVRLSSNYSTDALIHHFKFYLEWEDGTRDPTYNQLKDLSNFFKRPLPLFFFKNLPSNKLTQIDCRKLPDGYREGLSPKTLILVREVFNKAQYFKQLSLSFDLAIPPLVLKTKLSEDPKQVARKFRRDQKITQEIIQSFENESKALKYWRELIEGLGVLTFSISVAPEELRGGAFTIEGQPAIFFSSKDSVKARIFTLFHEFSHLLFDRKESHFWEEKLESEENPKAETFCNQFSAEFLLPEEYIKSHAPNFIDLSWVNKCSKENFVSSLVVVYRLQHLKMLSADKTKQMSDEIKKEYLESQKKKKATQKKSKGGPNPYLLQSISNSPKFLKRVFQALDNEQITSTEATRAINIKNIDKLRERVAI